MGRSKSKDEEEPDWDAEMSIFKQRMMRPNQLATLREMEAKVNVGKVRCNRACTPEDLVWFSITSRLSVEVGLRAAPPVVRYPKWPPHEEAG